MVSLQTGQQVYCNLASAPIDPAALHRPTKIDLTRDLTSYIHTSQGASSKAGWTGLVAMLRIVGSLDKLRRAPGTQEEWRSIARPNGSRLYMTEDQKSCTPVPVFENQPGWGSACYETVIPKSGPGGLIKL